MPRTPRRTAERLEFKPTVLGGVLDAMSKITKAGDGWINLLPGIDEDDAPPPSTGIAALFSPRTAGVVMATWAPPARTRNGMQGATVGILHSAGRFAARQLTTLGAPLADGWIVRQDNPRRGLIVSAPVDTDDEDVLVWTIAATTALCHLVLTGDWVADIFWPRAGDVSGTA
jgi:hypothetical protein